MADDRLPTLSARFHPEEGWLRRFGPTIHVRVISNDGNSAEVAAQLDTGAAGTGISPELAKRLGLERAGTGEIHEAGRDTIVAPYYRVTIRIVDNFHTDLDVVGLPSLGRPHDVLIGRDILSNGALMVDFKRNEVRLALWSNEPPDE